MRGEGKGGKGKRWVPPQKLNSPQIPRYLKTTYCRHNKL